MDSFIEIWDLDRDCNYSNKKTFGPMPTKEAYILYDRLSHIKAQPDKDVIIKTALRSAAYYHSKIEVFNGKRPVCRN